MSDLWLAVIAVAVAVMAAIQVAAIVLGLRLARRVDQLTTQVERDLRPLLQNLTDMTTEAQRAVQLASAQVERGGSAVRRSGGVGRADDCGGHAASSADRPRPGWRCSRRPGRRCRRFAICATPRAGARAPAGSSPRTTRSRCSSARDTDTGAIPGVRKAGGMRQAVRWAVAAAMAATVLTATTARAQDGASAAGASELAKVLSDKKLDAIAARDPSAPDAFVAALHFPGQLLVMSARYSAPALLNERLARREYRDLYIELNAASLVESRIFVTDIGADGLKAKRAKRDDPVRRAADAAGKPFNFDGSWREDKISEADYMKTFSEADSHYAKVGGAAAGRSQEVGRRSRRCGRGVEGGGLVRAGGFEPPTPAV